jgi:hypothetical protein
MRTNSTSEYDYDPRDYESYEERKKIKRVSSEHQKRREIKNWKKVWSEHAEDYDERDEFYVRK